MTEGERAILAEIQGTRSDVAGLSREIGGQGGLRERLAKIEAVMPKQPCPDLQTHIALHRKGEADAITRSGRAWDILRSWLTPAAFLAALAALGKAFKVL